jgi:hypothetical protein
MVENENGHKTPNKKRKASFGIPEGFIIEEHRDQLREVLQRFKNAILKIYDGYIQERCTEEHSIIDTSARLAAILYEKVLYRNINGQQLLDAFISEDEIVHSSRSIAEGALRDEEMHIIPPLFINSIMDSIPNLLSSGEIRESLSPEGMIGLASLCKLPKDKKIRKKIRREAKTLISQDSVASRLFVLYSGIFNGEFPNSKTKFPIDQFAERIAHPNLTFKLE